jgi:hypothetical protein
MDEEELEDVGATAEAEKQRLMRSRRTPSGRKKKSQSGVRAKKTAKKRSTRKSGKRKTR